MLVPSLFLLKEILTQSRLVDCYYHETYFQQETTILVQSFKAMSRYQENIVMI